MKFIKKFENFINDENRNIVAEEPKYNVRNGLAAKTYVELVFSKGAGDEVAEMVKEVGIDSPKSDEELDKAQEVCIEYFTKNPERIKNYDQPVQKTAVGGGNGSNIVTTNQVGGVFNESSKPDPDDDNCISIDLEDNEIDLFGKESPLIKLVSTDKITLLDNKVWFDKSDNNTRRVLDIFFDI